MSLQDGVTANVCRWHLGGQWPVLLQQLDAHDLAAGHGLGEQGVGRGVWVAAVGEKAWLWAQAWELGCGERWPIRVRPAEAFQAAT